MSLFDGLKHRSWLVLFLIASLLLIVGCGASPSADASADEDAQAEAALSANADAPEKNGAQKTAALPADSAEQVLSAVVGEPSAPAEQGFHQGVAVGFTEQGYPFLGDPDAPITVEEYSDFLCPFCQRHFQQTWPALFEEYVKGGAVKYVFRDMPLAALHPTAARGHVAARCVAEQGAASFWAMHEALFTRQNEWSQLPDPTDFLVGVAQGTGVDVATYQDCITSGQQESRVAESVAAGSALGFNGTPSFQFVHHETDETYTLIGAYPVATFTQYLDALVAGEAPPQGQGQGAQTEPADPGELPFWANAEGLAPDPERPGFTLAGDPYKGNPDAALVVVEFADFQCPACGQHALETQPVLDETFVDSGEVMWVFKNLPLKEHAHAAVAAAAAECAGEQGVFWEMHHLLFERLDQWSTEEDADAALLALADGLDLDMDAYSACFNGRQAMERVLNDLYDAQGVVSTTPNFVVLYGGRGRLMTSSLPAEQFVTSLQTRLEEATAAEAENAQP